MTAHPYTEKKFKKRLIFEGTVNFRADTVKLPNGKTATREFIDHPGAVAVLPVLPDGKIVFVRQFRYPVGRATLEIPAGKLHSPKDSPLKRVKAELKEETGYTAKKLTPILSYWPTPAFSTEVLYVYTATGLRGGKPNPDEDEFLTLETIPFKKAWQMAKTGKIRDSKTLIALQAWKIKLLEKK
ncbi:MAG TPA: ADP-ribose pyrophosphatase [Elusimicrobia bacterium]|nr:ADP-ribose pyrophosphatase [Elusimicrobiota bacterium]